MPNPRLPDHLLNFARQLRAEPTDAEARLWCLLRARQLGGFRFRRQHPCHGYILDFYCTRARLAIELDGGHHAADDAQLAHDRQRDQALVAGGIRVLRFWDNDVLANPEGVLDAIWCALHEEGPPRSQRVE